MSRAAQSVARQAEPGRRGLWLGILAYRWISLAWMTTQAFISRQDFTRDELVLWALAITVAWNVGLTLTRGWERPLVRWVDLGISVALLLVSGLVLTDGAMVAGKPFFATAYPASSALTVGAGGGVRAGLVGATALSIALALSRQVNGSPLTELERSHWTDLLNGMVYFFAAGGGAGLVSQVLRRSGDELEAANERAMLERERAARLAERESFGRRIHDSVLQTLALVNKRARELGSRPTVPGSDVRGLADIAEQQERELRSLLQTEPDEMPPGRVSLRTILEAAAFGVKGVPVTINVVGKVSVPADQVDELTAAVRQAVENAVSHAHASRITLFGERDDPDLVICVRDDGVGFVYDEEALRRDGKLGVLGSMKGRIEDLGGSMRVHSAPGRGTEIEFRVPTAEGGHR